MASRSVLYGVPFLQCTEHATTSGPRFFQLSSVRTCSNRRRSWPCANSETQWRAPHDSLLRASFPVLPAAACSRPAAGTGRRRSWARVPSSPRFRRGPSRPRLGRILTDSAWRAKQASGPQRKCSGSSPMRVERGYLLGTPATPSPSMIHCSALELRVLMRATGHALGKPVDTVLTQNAR